MESKSSTTSPDTRSTDKSTNQKQQQHGNKPLSATNNEPSATTIKTNTTNTESLTDLRDEIERLNRELVAAQQERSQSAAYGLELLNEKENLQSKYESIETLYEQSKQDLQELREAWNKAVAEQKISAKSVFEKEVQLLNDSDALAESFTHAKQEIEKELRLTKSQLESAISEKDRYIAERDELSKKIETIEQDRKSLRAELKDLKSRETKLFNENSELEEENVSLQKQVSNLRSTQVEFESSKHEIQRLQDEVAALNSQLEEVVTLRRITERQMQEALEALQSEREQKYALRKELDKRNSADSMINWTSLAALKGSPHLANLALRGFGDPSSRERIARDQDDGSANGFNEQDGVSAFIESEQGGFDMMLEPEMPSIEGSLFDEVHLGEIKKLQQNLEEKENQRSNLNTKLIEIQHKLDSKCRQADEIEKKLTTLCSLVEEAYSESDVQAKQNSPSRKQSIDINKQSVDNGGEVALANDLDTSANTVEDIVNEQGGDRVSNNNIKKFATTDPSLVTKQNVLDDFDNIYSHLQSLFAEYKSYQELHRSSKDKAKDASIPSGDGSGSLSDPMPSVHSETSAISIITVDKKSVLEPSDTLQGDDVASLRAMLYRKHEQLKQLRTILKSNKDSAEVALKNLKSKYDMEKAIVAETMTKLRLEHKRLNEDAATWASLRSHFSARIEEYNTEIEKLQSKLAASEQEKNTLNSILRMAIEQKVMLTQKLEALEMDREDYPQMGSGGNNGSKNGPNGQQQQQQQSRGGFVRGRGGLGTLGRGNSRGLRPGRPSGGDVRR